MNLIKMRTVAILFGFVVMVSTLQQDIFKLPAEKLIRTRQVAHGCAEELNIDDSDLIPKIGDGTLPRDETTNKFLHCFASKTELVDNVGHINIDKLASLVGNHPRVDEFKKALTKCNDVTKEDPIATVVYMNDCYTELSPILLVF